MYVSMCVSMSRLALFIYISETRLWNVIKLCMNISIGYAVILRFHDFHLRGQTKVAYIKICYKTSSFICISGSIFWSEVKQMWHMYKYVLKHPFRQDIFSKHIEMSCLRDNILTLALYNVHTRLYSHVV